MRFFRLIFGFILTSTIGLFFLWIAPQSLPQIFTKKGFQEFKTKVQSRYTRAQNLEGHKYLEGVEDFEPTTTVIELGRQLENSKNGDDEAIVEYSKYTQQIRLSTDHILHRLKNGELNQLIEEAGPAMKLYVENLKTRAQSLLNSDQVDPQDKIRIQNQLNIISQSESKETDQQ